MTDRSVRVVLSAVTSAFEQGMARAASASQRLAQSVQGLGSASERHRAALDNLGRGATVAGGLLAAGIGVAVKSYADFDQAMSAVKATGQDAASNLNALREAALQAGADTKYLATEAANGVEELSKAGLSAQDILGGGLTGALSLAAAGNMQVADAAELTATALTQFKLPGEQASHVADLLAAGAGKAQGEVSDMGMALKQGGLVAAQYGISIEETTGALSAFASAGLIGSDAGTSLKAMLIALANPSKESANLMSSLGINAYDASGKFIGLEGLAGQLQERLKGLTVEQRNQALAQIFGSDAMRAAGVLYDQGAAGIRKWTAEVNQQAYATGAAATKMGNLKGDIEQLGGSVESTMIKIGSSADGPLRSLVQGATGAVNALGNLSPSAQGAIAGLGGLGGAALLGVGGFIKLMDASRQTKDAFATLNAVHPRLASGLSGVGKAAGVAGAALALISVGQIAYDMNRLSVSAGDAEVAMRKFAASGNQANLDKIFGNVAQFNGDLANLSGAMQLVASSSDGFGKVKADIQGVVGMGGDITEARKGMEQLDATLLKMDGATAATAFARVAEEAKHLGLNGDQLAQQLPGVAAKLQELAKAQGQNVETGQAMTMAMNGQLPVAQALGGAMGTTAAAAGQQANAMGQLSGTNATVASSAQAAAAAQEKLGTTIFQTSSGAQVLIDANGKVAESDTVAAKEAAAHAKALETVQQRQNDVANSAIGLSGSLSSLEASYDEATKAVEENGRTLDIGTAKGRANRAALDNIASAAIKVREQQESMGESTDTVAKKTAEARAQFIKTATQMGMTKKEAEKLADSYGLVPPTVVTKVSAPGATQAKAQVDDLIRTIDRFKNLDGTTSTITLNKVTNISTQTNSGGRTATSAATGGYITGPGTGTSDSIPAWLSNGEFVIRAASVQALGLDRLHYLNRYGELPAFASGGHVGSGPASYAAAAPAPVHYSMAAPRFAGGGLVAQPAVSDMQVPIAQITSAITGALASATWVMDGRVIDVRMASREQAALVAARAR